MPDKLRHIFTEIDFIPDPSGDANRDPFRSYVVRRPLNLKDKRSNTSADDACDQKNWIAPTYSLRDLRLLGIIRRGTTGFALFRDSRARSSITGSA